MYGENSKLGKSNKMRNNKWKSGKTTDSIDILSLFHKRLRQILRKSFME